MGKVIADISVALDGFSAGPNVAMENSMGDGGEGLHEWMGSEAGRTGRDGTAVEGPQELLAGAGAVVVGRRMFDLGEEPWGDPPPFHDNPVFVVTHRAHAPIVKQGGTTYTFVTEGLEAALARARDAAGDRDVAVLGEAAIIQQCIRGGLLDELRLHVVHTVLGGGTALFGGLAPAGVVPERIGLIDTDGGNAPHVPRGGERLAGWRRARRTGSSTPSATRRAARWWRGSARRGRCRSRSWGGRSTSRSRRSSSTCRSLSATCRSVPRRMVVCVRAS